MSIIQLLVEFNDHSMHFGSREVILISISCHNFSILGLASIIINMDNLCHFDSMKSLETNSNFMFSWFLAFIFGFSGPSSRSLVFALFWTSWQIIFEIVETLPKCLSIEVFAIFWHFGRWFLKMSKYFRSVCHYLKILVDNSENGETLRKCLVIEVIAIFENFDR